MHRLAPGGMGVGSWIERRARIAPSSIALVHGSRSLTYAQLAGRIRRLANALRDLGAERGDRIAWLGPNHPAFLEALFAAGLVGCILAPANHRRPPEAVADVLARTEPRILLEHGAMAGVRLPGSIEHRIRVDGQAGDPGGARDYEQLVADASDQPVGVAVGLDDVLMLPHTSGTVGKPKGVMLTHANVTWNVVNLLTVADVRGGDVTAAIAPFFRVGGTGVNVLPVLFMGGTVIVSEATAADGLLDDLERHRVTVGFGNPDLLVRLSGASRWREADLSSIRFIITGGAPVPERLIRTYLERGITLLQGYGLSEAAPVVLLLDPASALERVGSAGRPPLLVDVRIVDPDGHDAGAARTGELWVRGPNVMAGYWRDPGATREVLTDDGWLRTGDAARMDDEGFVWIVDRMRDRFSVGGGVVYPGDVERVLLDHPAVADAGVAGAPGPDGETIGVAFVVLGTGRTATEDELIAFVAAHLAAHQVPATIEFVDRLPRNTVGKLQRDRLQRRP